MHVVRDSKRFHANGLRTFDRNTICVISLLSISCVFVIQNIRDDFCMKRSVNLTMDSALLKEIDTLRGREKRSTFIEHLVKLGLKAYQAGSQ